jgi:hypothetical protein
MDRLGCVQVSQATKLKAKAGRLQEEGSKLLEKASDEKSQAAELKVCSVMQFSKTYLVYSPSYFFIIIWLS